MSVVRAYYGTTDGKPIKRLDKEIADIVLRHGGEQTGDGFWWIGDRGIISQFADEVSAVNATDELLSNGYIVSDGAWMRKHSKAP